MIADLTEGDLAEVAVKCNRCRKTRMDFYQTYLHDDTCVARLLACWTCGKELRETSGRLDHVLMPSVDDPMAWCIYRHVYDI